MGTHYDAEISELKAVITGACNLDWSADADKAARAAYAIWCLEEAELVRSKRINLEEDNNRWLRPTRGKTGIGGGR